MTSVEIMAPTVGDALLDLKAGKGVGFDECAVDDVVSEGNTISFHLTSPDTQRTFLVRFQGVQPKVHYRIRWNGGAAVQMSGEQMLKDGLIVDRLS